MKRGAGAFVRREDFARGAPLVEPSVLAETPFAHRAGTLPTAYTIAALPPVMDQGQIDSCCAHAFGYGLGGCTALRGQGAEHVSQWPSRAWLFAKAALNDSVDGSCSTNGTYPLSYLEQLVVGGAPTEAQVPYRADVAYLNDVQSKLERTAPDAALRIGSYRTMVIEPIHRARQLATIKSHLASDQVVACAGDFANDYQAPALRDGVFYAGDGFADTSHAQLIVGYDDERGDGGALLLQNSYGDGWPVASPTGRIWWDYSTFVNSQSCIAIALPSHSGPPRGIALEANAKDAPLGTITAIRRAVTVAGSYDLVFSHTFAAAIRLRRVRVTLPDGRHRDDLTTMHTSNGYSMIPATSPWRAKTDYRVEFHASTPAGLAVAYRATFRLD